MIDLIRVNGLTSVAINIDPDNDPIVDEDVQDEASDQASTDVSPKSEQEPKPSGDSN